MGGVGVVFANIIDAVVEQYALIDAGIARFEPPNEVV